MNSRMKVELDPCFNSTSALPLVQALKSLVMIQNGSEKAKGGKKKEVCIKEKGNGHVFIVGFQKLVSQSGPFVRRHRSIHWFLDNEEEGP